MDRTELSAQELASLIVFLGDIVDRERIVFDVAGLKHIDSTFLRFLVGLRDHVARDRSATVELVGVTPRLHRILRITGLARAFVLQEG
jgi:anti-anti-sigma factor